MKRHGLKDWSPGWCLWETIGSFGSRSLWEVTEYISLMFLPFPRLLFILDGKVGDFFL